jgi:hypothetical protein
LGHDRCVVVAAVPVPAEIVAQGGGQRHVGARRGSPGARGARSRRSLALIPPGPCGGPQS